MLRTPHSLWVPLLALALAGCSSDRPTVLGPERGGAIAAPGPAVPSAPFVNCAGAPSEITSGFNGTPIAPGNHVWFNSVFKYTGPTDRSVTVVFRNGTVRFTANGVEQVVPIPDATVYFSPGSGTASTTFDAGLGEWVTTTPFLGKNVFLSGAALHLPAGLPGGVKPVIWSGEFVTDAPGVRIQWQWAAAAYKSFAGSLADLLVKAVDGRGDAFDNSDHAGTPENYKSFVTGGARGGGGSNFTGSYSATKAVTAPECVVVGGEPR